MDAYLLYRVQWERIHIAIPHPSSKPPCGVFESTFPSGEGFRRPMAAPTMGDLAGEREFAPTLVWTVENGKTGPWGPVFVYVRGFSDYTIAAVMMAIL